ncbi:MAG TPA: preprotein translocase subunit SecG [Bdellovibrionales bacterium]|nr:preprotein translocase subunit SecG [Bdellovibrionales bacterium]
MVIITVLHVVVCLLLIALVLLQDPKSGGAGGVFGGGGSNSLMGATGAVTFLTKLTRYSAIVFGVTCILLSLFSKPNVGSVLDTVPAQAAPPAATAPATEAAPAPTSGTETAPAAPAEQPAAK